MLRVGDVVFIPIRPDEFLGVQMPSGSGDPRVYRVKRGEHSFKILRNQQGLQGRKAIRSAFEQVKRLNPRKDNGDLFYAGEPILLPSLRKGMRLNTTAHRWFTLQDKKFGVFFGKVSPEVMRALSEKEKVKVVELDLESLSAREIPSTLLVAIGKGTTYQKHRFPTADLGPKNKLVLSVPGFFCRPNPCS